MAKKTAARRKTSNKKKPGTKRTTRKKAAKKKTRRKPGRPSKFTTALGKRICLRMCNGESLREVCRDPKMPHKSTVMRWLADDVQTPARMAFRDQYAKAREELLEYWAEEILEIADDGTNDWEERENARTGETHIALNTEAVNRSRLRVDTRKWLLSKLGAKKYGDRLALTDRDGGPLTVNIVDPSRA